MTEELRNTLIADLLPTAEKVTSRFTIPGYESCDLKSEAALVLFELLGSDKENQGMNLSKGYLITAIKNRLLNLKKRALFLDLVSLDEPVGEDEYGDMTRHEVVEDEKALNPEDAAVAADLAAHVLDQFNKLPKIEREIVAMRLGLDNDDNNSTSFRIVAEHFEMTDDRATRIYRRSITTLSQAIQ